jgi:hypothetical protein
MKGPNVISGAQPAKQPRHEEGRLENRHGEQDRPGQQGRRRGSLPHHPGGTFDEFVLLFRIRGSQV